VSSFFLRYKKIISPILLAIGIVSKKYRFLGPYRLYTYLPSKCSYHCSFCKYKSPKNHLSFDELKKLFFEALNLGTFRFNFLGGDPLLYPKIKELVEYILSASHNTASISLTTNETSLAKVGIEFIKKNKLTLWISLRAGSFSEWKNIVNPTKKEESFWFESKKIMRDFIPKNRLIIHNSLNKLNYHSIDSVLSFAIETGIRRLFFRIDNSKPEISLSSEEVKGVTNKLKKLSKIFKEHNIITNINKFFSKSDKNESFYKKNRCFIPWLASFIGVTGNVYLCRNGICLGNIREKNFSEIWKTCYSPYIKECINIKSLKKVRDCNCDICSEIEINKKMTAFNFLNLFPLVNYK